MGRLKSLNPVLPDLMITLIGLLALGETVIVLFLPLKRELALGYATGALYSMAALIHMTVVLDRAVYYEDKGAIARTIGGFLVRTLIFILLECLMYLAGDVTAMLAMLISSMFTMKVSAYLQPFTHRVLEKLNRKGGE